MSWIKATDKYPSDWKLSRLIGTEKEFPAMFATHVIADLAGKTYKKDQMEWFDTSEPSFSIEDMKRCWNESRIKFPNGSFSEDFETFMYNEYNIDLTK